MSRFRWSLILWLLLVVGEITLLASASKVSFDLLSAVFVGWVGGLVSMILIQDGWRWWTAYRLLRRVRKIRRSR